MVYSSYGSPVSSSTSPTYQKPSKKHKTPVTDFYSENLNYGKYSSGNVSTGGSTGGGSGGSGGSGSGRGGSSSTPLVTTSTTARYTGGEFGAFSGNLSGGVTNTSTPGASYTYQPTYGPTITTTSPTARVLTPEGFQSITNVGKITGGGTSGTGVRLPSGGYLPAGASVKEGGSLPGGALKYPITAADKVRDVDKVETAVQTSPVLKEASTLTQASAKISADLLAAPSSFAAALSPTKEKVSAVSPSINNLFRTGIPINQQQSFLPTEVTPKIVQSPTQLKDDYLTVGTPDARTLSDFKLDTNYVPSILQKDLTGQYKGTITVEPPKEVLKTYAPAKILGQIESELGLEQIKQGMGEGVVKGNIFEKGIDDVKTEINRFFNNPVKQQILQADLELRKYEENKNYNIDMSKLSTEGKKLTNDILQTNKKYEDININIENINKKYENLDVINKQLTAQKDTLDLTDPIAVTAFNEKVILLTSELDKVNKEAKETAQITSQLELQDKQLQEKATALEAQMLKRQKSFIEKDLTLTKLSEDIKELDPFYKKQKEDYRSLEELRASDASLGKKLLGEAFYYGGKAGYGGLGLVRDVSEFVVVSPTRAAIASGERARAGEGYTFKGVTQAIIPGIQQAKGFYDWENPELSKYGSMKIGSETGLQTIGYKSTTGLNTRALSGGIIVGTLGLSTAAGTSIKTVAPSVIVKPVASFLTKAGITTGVMGLVGAPTAYTGYKQVKGGQAQLSQIDSALQQLETNKVGMSEKAYLQSKDYLEKQKVLVERSRKKYGEVVGDVIGVEAQAGTLALSSLQAAKFGRNLQLKAISREGVKNPVYLINPKTGKQVDVKFETERYVGTRGGTFGKPQKEITVPTGSEAAGRTGLSTDKLRVLTGQNTAVREGRISAEKLLPQESTKVGESITTTFTEKTTQGLAKTQLKGYTTDVPGQYTLVQKQDFGTKNWGSWFGKNRMVGKRIDVTTQFPGETFATRQIFVNNKLIRTLQDVPISNAGLIGAVDIQYGKMIRDKPIQISKSQVLQSGKQEGTINLDNVIKGTTQKLKGEIQFTGKGAQYSERLPETVVTTRTEVTGQKFYTQLAKEPTTRLGDLKVGASSQNVRPSVTTSEAELIRAPQESTFNIQTGQFETTPFFRGIETTTVNFPGVESVKATTITGQGSFNVVGSQPYSSWDLRSITQKIGSLPSLGQVGKKGSVSLLYGLGSKDYYGGGGGIVSSSDTATRPSSGSYTGGTGGTGAKYEYSPVTKISIAGKSKVSSITSETVNTKLFSSVSGALAREVAPISYAAIGGISTLGALSTSILSTISPLTITTPISRTSAITKTSLLSETLPLSEVTPVSKAVYESIAGTGGGTGGGETVSRLGVIEPIIPTIPGFGGLTGLGSLGGIKLPSLIGFSGGGFSGEGRYGSRRRSTSWLVENKLKDYAGEWFAKQKLKTPIGMTGVTGMTGSAYLKNIGKGVNTNLRGKL